MVHLGERCHRALEPLHSMIYFSPELQERLTAAGLRPGRMCVFASRVAAMGAVTRGAVAGIFYTFNPDYIGRYLPEAWTLAAPERIVAGRVEAAGDALRRLLGPEVIASPELGEAAELARAAATECVHNGRPLYAALAELEWPTEPHQVLWHAITLLREFRGDGHVAVLVANGLDGLPALITHTATGFGFREPRAKELRGWSEADWADAVRWLRDQDLLDEAGELTERGVRLRQDIEDATNRLAERPWTRLGEDKADRLREIGARLARQVVAAGAFPDDLFGHKVFARRP